MAEGGDDEQDLEASLRACREAYFERNRGGEKPASQKEKGLFGAFGRMVSSTKESAKAAAPISQSISGTFSNLKSKTKSSVGGLLSKVSTPDPVSLPSASSVLAAAKSATTGAASRIRTEIPS
eukprot:CAMPEP_0113699998 /NCGR_PEP_ID=MMETSP0038_2-20120614/23682_1 /TAXON_ID=2898 /ORGANISM="Cryptomonas paramecium" /LENGTH=122 /DNA_ID=CAMNT_0000623545 /DNA_START=3 /DNA_END=368 /DNA_ORIENTATION=+ /assembly_acc=CAM_ASM_000170